MPAPPATLAPDAASHLSDGVVVQTRLVARLLGLRVLRVDGVVQLAPARLAPVTAGAVVDPPRACTDTTAEALVLGAGLAKAARLLDDGDRRLR